MADARAPKLDRALAFVVSAAVGLALWALVRQALFEGQAQSYDAPLYVRSLWGIAHGDFNNALIDQPSLGIHSQVVLLLLAPFARAWHAADVLIAAQALAFGGTLFVWLCALLRARPATGSGGTILLVLWASVLFTYGTPLLANPFVFDVRPELLGVFFATAGLLRCAECERFDASALALLVVSATAREEFALIAACALVLAPVARTGVGLSLRTRAILAAGLVAYFVGNSYLYESSRALSHAAHLTSDAAWQDLLVSKAQLFAAFAGAGGGLALIGFRWLGAALPGLGFLALSTWMARDQISFHYGMFVAPALLTASYAGFRTLVNRPHLPRAWLGAHVAVALACGVFLSALPGGGRFARPFFNLEHAPWLADAHRLARTVPPDHSLWMQYMLATPYANRASIRVFEVDNDAPWQPDSVLLARKQWPGRGPELRAQGYKLAGLSGVNFALLSRRMSKPLTSLLTSEGCENASVRWPDAALDLCNAWLELDGHVMVVLGRSDATHAAGSRGTQLELRTGPEHARVTMPLALLDGLIAMEDLPAGRTVWSKSPKPVPSSKVTFALMDANGQPVPLVVQGQQRDRVTLTLLPPP